MKQCARCKGQGHIPAYDHVEMGRCFRCGGSGNEPLEQKVFVYKITLDDGHPRPTRAKYHVMIDRLTEGYSHDQALHDLVTNGKQPYKGGTGILKIISVELVNVATKLILQ